MLGIDAHSLLKLLRVASLGETCLADMAAKGGLQEEDVRELLGFLAEKDVVKIAEDKVLLEEGFRLSLGVEAVRLGASVEEVCRSIDWREFEGLISTVLRENDYVVEKNVRLKEPRVEVDIFAYVCGRGLAVDCKHWRRTVGHSVMGRVALKQLERARRLIDSGVASKYHIDYIIPVVVTLFDESLRVVAGVPVVPAFKFSRFLLEVDGYIDILRVVRR